MRRVELILCFLGILFLYGCSLDKPIDLGVKCSDDDRHLSAVIYAGMECKPEDSVGDRAASCGRFADAFRYGYCPTDYFCIEDKDASFLCSMTQCHYTQHEHNGKCEDNTVFDCGQSGFECNESMAGWVSGSCKSEPDRARCVATECLQPDYSLNEETGLCSAVRDCPAGTHIYQGECVADDVEHCGRHDRACSARIAGWMDGTCREGECIPTACDSGYELENGACTALIDCGEDKHIYNGKCEADTVSHCGYHENDCSVLDGWDDGVCKSAHCYATSCSSGYDLREDTGTCRVHVAICDDGTEHVFNNDCEANTIEHCGKHDYACALYVPGWIEGTCEMGSCRASVCENGYSVNDRGQCVISMEPCDPGEHIADGACAADSVEACGSSNNNCTRRAGWMRGTCEQGVCVATACHEDYMLEDGQCIARPPCKTGERYQDGECVKIDGYCNSEWDCIVTHCDAGYYLKEGKCYENSDTSCGSDNNACDTEHGSVCDKALGECVCAQGYMQISDTECIKISREDECDTDHYATVNVGNSSIRAYCLSSKQDILDMQAGMEGGVKWPSDNQSQAFFITQDIDLGQQNGWVPIEGDSIHYLFGNQYTIRGTLNCEGECSLFDKMGSGTASKQVNDLMLELDVNGVDNSAALFQMSSYTQINRIRFSGTVVSYEGSAAGVGITKQYGGMDQIEVNGSMSAAGSVGGVLVSAGYSTIRHAYVDGYLYGSDVGGIMASAGPSTVEDSEFHGAVYGNANIGGIIGKSSLGNVKHSFVDAVLNGNYGTTNIGGIVGSVENTDQGILIQSSYFNGNIYGKYGFVGGIVANTSANLTIQECGSFGKIMGITSNSITYAGGIFGYGAPTVTHSFSVSDIQNASSVSRIGTISGPGVFREVYTMGNMSNAGEMCGGIHSVYYSSVIPETTELVLSSIMDENEYGSCDGSIPCCYSYYEPFTFDDTYHQIYQGRYVYEVMNEAEEEAKWESRACKMAIAASGGKEVIVHLAIPKSMPDIPFCVKE